MPGPRCDNSGRFLIGQPSGPPTEGAVGRYNDVAFAKEHQAFEVRGALRLDNWRHRCACKLRKVKTYRNIIAEEVCVEFRVDRRSNRERAAIVLVTYRIRIVTTAHMQADLAFRFLKVCHLIYEPATWLPKVADFASKPLFNRNKVLPRLKVATQVGALRKLEYVGIEALRVRFVVAICGSQQTIAPQDRVSA